MQKISRNPLKIYTFWPVEAFMTERRKNMYRLDAY